MADPKITTQFVFPPIPDRRWDWSATFEDYDGAEDSSTRHHIGYGRTEAEAIADLVENYGSKEPQSDICNACNKPFNPNGTCGYGGCPNGGDF